MARPARPPLGIAFTKLWIAAIISSTGDGVTFIAAPLLAATLTRDPRQIAGIETALALPWLCFSLPAGALVDRWDRRRVLWIVDTFRSLIVAAIAVVAGTGHATMPFLYLAFFLLGSGQVFFDNADQAFLPQVVGSNGLERANARLQTATLGAGQLLGPAVGSLLFAAAIALPFSFDAGTFAIAALLVWTIRGHFRPVRAGSPGDEQPRALRGEIAEGLRFLFADPLLRTLAFVLGSMNLLDLAARATFVLYAQERLHLSDLGFGLVLTMFAVGGVLGGVVADRMGPHRPRHTLAAVVAVLMGAYVAIPLFHTAVAAGIAFCASGIASVVWNVITVSARQRVIPAALFARVNSVYRLLSWGTMPIGAALGGVIAHRYGLAAPFWFAAGGHALLVIVAVRHLHIGAVDAAIARSLSDGPSAPSAGS